VGTDRQTLGLALGLGLKRGLASELESLSDETSMLEPVFAIGVLVRPRPRRASVNPSLAADCKVLSWSVS
jgi:hypothetical protein